MSKINDGEHAFPTQTWEYDGQNNVLPYQESGMSLQDWFAGAALQGLLAAQIYGFNDNPANGPFARMAYDMADAMLKERKARHDNQQVGCGDEDKQMQILP